MQIPSRLVAWTIPIVSIVFLALLALWNFERPETLQADRRSIETTGSRQPKPNGIPEDNGHRLDPSSTFDGGAGKSDIELREQVRDSNLKQIRGRVSLASGEAVEGARIEVVDMAAFRTDLKAMEREFGSFPRYLAYSQTDGTFVVDGLPDTYFSVMCLKEGFAKEIDDGVAAGEQNLGFVLEGGVPIRGRVLDEKRDPIPAALASLTFFHGISMNQWNSDFTLTDPEGVFALGPVVRETSVGMIRISHPESAEVGIPISTLVGDSIDLGDIVLPHGEWIRGLVLDATGRPLEGVSVRLSQTNSLPLGCSENLETKTDGSFACFGAHPGKEYRVQLSKEGYRQFGESRDALTPSAQDRVFFMLPSATLSGAIETESGGPLTGPTKVSLLRLDPRGAEEEEVASQTLEEGQSVFALKDLDPETFVLFVQNPNLRPARISGFRVAEGENPPFRISLAAGRRIQGRIVDGATRKPLSKVSVRMATLDPSGRLERFLDLETSTDDSGRFDFNGAFSEPGLMSLRLGGYAPSYVRLAPSSEDLDLGEVPVESGGHLRVEVRSGYEPITETTFKVQAHNLDLGTGRKLGLDPQGYYATENLPPGQYVVVAEDRVHSALHVHSTSVARAVTIERGRTAEIVLDFRGGGSMRGRVFKRGGDFDPGLDEGEVRLLTEGGNPDTPLASSICDFEGGYSLFGIPPGNYYLQFRTTRWSSPLEVRKNVTVAEGDKLEVNLELSAAGVAGKIVDESSGAGLLGAQVAVQPEAGGAGLHLFSRTDGSFSISSLPAGSYRLTAKKPGFGTRCLGPVEVEADRMANAGEIALSPGAALEVSIRDSVGRPIGGAEAVLTPSSCGPRGARRAAAGKDGLARFADLGEGASNLEVRARGYPPAAATLSPESGKESKATIVLRSVGDLRIEVQDSKGLPVPGATVEVSEDSTHTPVSTWVEAGYVKTEPKGSRTGSDGAVLFRDLPQGLYSVRVKKSGNEATASAVEVGPGEKSLAIGLVAK